MKETRCGVRRGDGTEPPRRLHQRGAGSLTRKDGAMNEDLQILMLIKPGNPPERYVITYDEASRDDAMKQLARWAANHELSFSWADAAVLSHRLRETALEAA